MSQQPLNSNDFSYLGKLLSKQTYKDKDGNVLNKAFIKEKEYIKALNIGIVI